MPTWTRIVLLGVALLPIGYATGEVAHLAVYAFLGQQAELVTATWRMRLIDIQVFSLHATALKPVPLPEQVADNALGPIVSATLLMLVRSQVIGTTARAALLAGCCVQGFLAVVETAYPLLEGTAHLDADFLLIPEVTYAAVLVIVAAVAVAATRRHQPGASDQPG